MWMKDLVARILAPSVANTSLTRLNPHIPIKHTCSRALGICFEGRMNYNMMSLESRNSNCLQDMPSTRYQRQQNWRYLMTTVRDEIAPITDQSFKKLVWPLHSQYSRGPIFANPIAELTHPLVFSFLSFSQPAYLPPFTSSLLHQDYYFLQIWAYTWLNLSGSSWWSPSLFASSSQRYPVWSQKPSINIHVLTIIYLVGFYTRSLALVADAFHYVQSSLSCWNFSFTNPFQLNDLIGFIVAFAALKVRNMFHSLWGLPLTKNRSRRKRTLRKIFPLAGSALDFSVPSSTAFSFSHWASVFSCNL